MRGYVPISCRCALTNFEYKGLLISFRQRLPPKPHFFSSYFIKINDFYVI